MEYKESLEIVLDLAKGYVYGEFIDRPEDEKWEAINKVEVLKDNIEFLIR